MKRKYNSATTHFQDDETLIDNLPQERGSDEDGDSSITMATNEESLHLSELSSDRVDISEKMEQWPNEIKKQNPTSGKIDEKVK